MFRPRIIPVLLLQKNVLVKSTRFKKHHYIGDPINAVKIFNDLKADELAFLDIDATKEDRLISLDFVKDVGEEANMPFAVGGGIRTIDDIRKIVNAGAEKVIIGSAAVKDPEFIRMAAEEFGSSTIVVCMDVGRSIFKGESVCYLNGTKSTKHKPIEFAQLMEACNAGELIVQSIEKDGSMTGYDIELIKSISQAVTIPVIALGGAGKSEDLSEAYDVGMANGLAAGSLFVYHGTNKGVLINYPDNGEVQFERKL